MSTKLISYSHLTFFFLSYIYSRAARIASICQPSIRNGIQVACNVASVRMHSTVKHRCFAEREIFIVKMITFGELFFLLLLHALLSEYEHLNFIWENIEMCHFPININFCCIYFFKVKEWIWKLIVQMNIH